MMKRVEIDQRRTFPRLADQFITQGMDFVITVCDKAKETLSLFSGRVKTRIRTGLDVLTQVARDQKMQVLRKIDEIQNVGACQ